MHRLGNGVRDFFLHREDVGELPIVLSGPDTHASGRLDQLRRDTHPLAVPLHGALDKVSRAELAADVAEIVCMVLEFKRRHTADDQQVRYVRKRGSNLDRHAFGEEVLLWIARQVSEWQYRNRSAG